MTGLGFMSVILSKWLAGGPRAVRSPKTGIGSAPAGAPGQPANRVVGQSVVTSVPGLFKDDFEKRKNQMYIYLENLVRLAVWGVP